MENKTYNPISPWTSYDFKINQIFWSKRPSDERDDIRFRNLSDLSIILSQHNILHWLYGRTLLGAHETGNLVDDHDDDIGIYVGQKPPVLELIQGQLKDSGFALIRSTDDLLSIERDYRYIDICVFSRKGNKHLGYNKRKHYRHHFSQLEDVAVNETLFPAPCDTSALLRKTYKKKASLASIPVKALWRLAQLRSPAKVKLKIQQGVVNRVTSNQLVKIPLKFNLLTIFNIRYRVLSQDDFLNLSIEPNDSFNWRWRKRHLDLVTDNGRLSLIGDIVAYLSDPQVQGEIEKNVVESDTNTPFADPANLDIDFWWSGNNYFWYCVWYQYRRNVQPYAKANEYIRQGTKPSLFTSDYYDSLPEMSEHEIDQFLDKSPIEVTDGAITGGKHRALAMIGRLVFGKSYRPIPIIEIS